MSLKNYVIPFDKTNIMNKTYLATIPKRVHELDVQVERLLRRTLCKYK